MSWCGYRYTEVGELKIYTRTVRSALCLSELERVVLLFILDRTIGWHKVWDTISSAQFVSGVIRRGGQRVASGTRLTTSQINEALSCLRESEAIELDRSRGKVAFKINEYWCHPDLRDCGMWELHENDYDYDNAAITDGKRSRQVE